MSFIYPVLPQNLSMNTVRCLHRRIDHACCDVLKSAYIVCSLGGVRLEDSVGHWPESGI